MHGYELRKQVNTLLGSFRAFSFGSLYPALRDLEQRGLITSSREPGGRGGRGRVVYELTAEGKDRFGEMLTEAGPTTWEDESFEVRLAFFTRTDETVRMETSNGVLTGIGMKAYLDEQRVELLSQVRGYDEPAKP